jgi:proline dehydrogenase
VRHLVTRTGLFRPVVNRFVAGETPIDAVAAVADLNARGLLATVDLLGEATVSDTVARQAAFGYGEILEALSARGLRSHVSVKLSQLGLDLSLDTAETWLRQIVAQAQTGRTFVRVDMEDSGRLAATQRVFDRVWETGARNLGIALQAYLYRTPDDARRFAARGVSIRLCKGAYAEPPDVAYARKSDVDQAFADLMRDLLGGESYLAIATHDERLIEQAKTMAAARNVAVDRFEFQMLYGIRRDLQESLARQGYHVRVYVPFGAHWYPYFMRRLAERPANLFFLARHLIRR